MIERELQEILSSKDLLTDEHATIHNGLLRVNIGGEKETIDDRGDTIIVIRGGKWGFVDESGEEKIPLIYDRLSYWGDNFWIAGINDKEGVINLLNGETVIDFIYDKICGVRKNIAIVKQNNKYGLVKVNDGIFLNCIYEYMDFITWNERESHYDTLIVRSGDVWGLISIEGKIILPTSYKFISTFFNHESDWHSGFPATNRPALAKKGDKYGLVTIVDRNEGNEIVLFNEVVPCVYDKIYGGDKSPSHSYDEHPFLCVKKTSPTTYKCDVFDVPFAYAHDTVFQIKHRSFFTCDRIVKKSSLPSGYIFESAHRQGVLDTAFNVIIPCIYEQIEDSCMHFLVKSTIDTGRMIEWVSSDRSGTDPERLTKYGLLNGNGDVLLPVIYDSIKVYLDRNWETVCEVHNRGDKPFLFFPRTRASLPLYSYSEEILIIDLETNSLPANSKGIDYRSLENWPYIVEAGIITLGNIKQGQTFALKEKKSYILHPESKFTISPEAESVHGITQRISETDSFPRKEVLSYIWNSIGSASYIVGHNVNFDLNVLKCEFLRNKIADEKQIFRHFSRIKREICTMRESTDFCAIKTDRGDYKWPTLGELYETLFNKKLPVKHRAAEDADMTLQCFLELMKKGIIKLDKATIQSNDDILPF